MFYKVRGSPSVRLRNVSNLLQLHTLRHLWVQLLCLLHLQDKKSRAKRNILRCWFILQRVFCCGISYNAITGNYAEFSSFRQGLVQQRFHYSRITLVNLNPTKILLSNIPKLGKCHLFPVLVMYELKLDNMLNLLPWTCNLVDTDSIPYYAVLPW